MPTNLTLRQRLALELNRQLVKEGERNHPLAQVFWECTLRCNMRCRHCGSDCKTSSLHPDMPFEDFRKVLLEVKERYDSHKIMIVITGGEPLVRKDLERCGRAIYDLEFPWGIVTNGRALTRQRLDSLLAAGLHSATVSLDGFEADHNWMRGVPDAFKRASEAVGMFASTPSIAFDVVTCVNSRNYSSLEDLKEYLISLGLRRWRLFTVFPVGRAAGDPELQLSPEQHRGLMDFIVKARKEGRIKVEFACEGFLGEYEGLARDHLYACHAGISIASVLVDGSIGACPSIRADYNQGNIHRDSFVDVWENRFAPFRDRGWAKTGPCAGCKYFRYCQGGGMHLRGEGGELVLCHLDRL